MDAAAAARELGLQVGRECLEAALGGLALGWSMLIVCPPDHVGVGRGHGKNCSSPGKAPWGLWKEFQERLPTEGELRSKWHDLPNGNLGLAYGPVSGLIGIDVDGSGGETKLAELSAGDLPPTLEFRTPGGGRRLLYRIPAGVELRTTYEKPGIKEEVRFQARGAQTVMPPSIHKSGGRYAWVDGHGPASRSAAEAPKWLVAQLRAKGQSSRNGQVGPASPDEKIGEGRRDDTLISMAGSMRRKNMSEAAINAALMTENESRCDPPLPEEQVRKIVASIMRYDPENPDAWEGWTPEDGDQLRSPVTWLRSQECFRRVPIRRIRKLGKSDGDYEMILEGGGVVKIGKAKNVLCPNDVQAAILDETAVAIPSFTRERWRPIAEFIARAAEVDDINAEQENETRLWLSVFTTKGRCHGGEVIDLDNKEALAVKLSCIKSADSASNKVEDCYFWTHEKALYLRASALLAFIRNPAFFGANVSQPDLRRRLRRLGFRHEQVAARGEAGAVSVRLWISPTGLVLEED